MLGQEKIIGAFEARRRFGKLLQDVTAGRGKYIVERNGEAIAALVPIETYNQWKQRRALFFDKLRGTAQRTNLTDEEAMQLVTEAVGAVRAAQQEV